ncbi:hypothetical protein ABZ851_14420 [Streptomyces sp. NPDC047049]|uniref:hypothetical protein n=1 Tax=Streptomyces sp. NPDC047049 TaxID=3156688 RepID=UPI0033D8299E
MRTPAGTVLAAAALHAGATTFGMFGCGVRGREHVRNIGMTVCDITVGNAIMHRALERGAGVRLPF